MIQILEQGTGAFLCAVLPLLGGILQLLLYGYYTHLEKECRQIKTTGNKTVQGLREQLAGAAGNPGERAYGSYPQYLLDSCCFCKIPLPTYERLCRWIPGMSLLVGAMLAVTNAYYGGTVRQSLTLLFLGIWFTTGLLLLRLFFGYEEKRNRLRFCLMEYEGSIRREPKEEETAPTPLLSMPRRMGEAGQEETAKPAEPGKQRKEGRAAQEKRRLTEELLRERRRLTAQQYREEPPVEEFSETALAREHQEDVQAPEDETVKYEKMLRSVLAEFLSLKE